MMRLLGRLFLIFIFATFSFAAEAILERSVINQGESAILILKAEGKSVKFPELSDIAGFEITSKQSRQNIQVINGEFTKTLEKIYTFYPTNDIKIPPFSIEVDGKEESTKPLHVKVKNATTSRGNVPFKVEVKVSNDTPYVGELIRVDILFKRDASRSVADLQLQEPNFDGFWVKGNKSYGSTMEGDYIVQKLSFWMWAAKSGELNIDPIMINVATKVAGRDIFNMLIDQVSWQRVRSNKVALHVKDLPQDVTLVGKLSLDVSVDKNEVEIGKPINLTVQVRGNGNLDDVPDLDLHVKDAVIFSDKPKIKGHIDNDIYRGVWEQKIALSPSNDTTIEAIKIPYFNIKTNKIDYLESEPISIKVKGSLPQAVSVTNAKEEIKVIKSIRYDYILYAFILGLLLGVLILFIIQKAMKTNINISLKKSDKELLRQLLAYQGRSQELDNWIEKLEENCYGGANHTIARGEIEKLIKSYEA